MGLLFVFVFFFEISIVYVSTKVLPLQCIRKVLISFDCYIVPVPGQRPSKKQRRFHAGTIPVFTSALGVCCYTSYIRTTRYALVGVSVFKGLIHQSSSVYLFESFRYFRQASCLTIPDMFQWFTSIFSFYLFFLSADGDYDQNILDNRASKRLTDWRSLS